MVVPAAMQSWCLWVTSLEIHGYILSSFFPCIVLPTGNLWGTQVVGFIYVLRIDKFCHGMYIMEHKYTDAVTWSLGTEVACLF